jgi:hypothetical protein
VDPLEEADDDDDLPDDDELLEDIGVAPERVIDAIKGVPLPDHVRCSGEKSMGHPRKINTLRTADPADSEEERADAGFAMYGADG